MSGQQTEEGDELEQNIMADMFESATKKSITLCTNLKS